MINLLQLAAILEIAVRDNFLGLTRNNQKSPAKQDEWW